MRGKTVTILAIASLAAAWPDAAQTVPGGGLLGDSGVQLFLGDQAALKEEGADGHGSRGRKGRGKAKRQG